MRSGITLSVEYGADRTACQLLIAPTQLLVDVQEPIPPPMSSQGVSDVLQEVVPIATRGKQTEDRSGEGIRLALRSVMSEHHDAISDAL